VPSGLHDRALSLTVCPLGVYCGRPSRGDVFGSLALNYKLALNLLGVAIFGALLWLAARRGATDHHAVAHHH
jgi:hypothetical protein